MKQTMKKKHMKKTYEKTGSVYKKCLEAPYEKTYGKKNHMKKTYEKT